MKGVELRMSNYTDISQYTIVGNLVDNKNICVYVAAKTPDTLDDLYIINRFPHTTVNENLFKGLFTYYSSDNKSKDMDNFFASEDYFFAVFKYKSGESIKKIFAKNVTTVDYNTRCKILSEILVKIDSISSMPLSTLLCATLIQNICIDSDGDFSIIYNFSEIDSFENANEKNLYENIAKIIEAALETELSKKYNHKLQIVLDKCRKQIYKSIPELIFDLEKTEEQCKDNNLKSYIMDYIDTNKKMIKRFSWIGGAILIVVGGASYIYSNFFSKNPASTSSSISIGNVTYTAGTTSGNENVISNGGLSTSSEEIVEIKDLTISPDADIEFEDYIVQHGDTVKSICDANYGNDSFISAIASFNNISADSELVAGSIIKLPNRDAVLNLAK